MYCQNTVNVGSGTTLLQRYKTTPPYNMLNTHLGKVTNIELLQRYLLLNNCAEKPHNVIW